MKPQISDYHLLECSCYRFVPPPYQHTFAVRRRAVGGFTAQQIAPSCRLEATYTSWYLLVRRGGETVTADLFERDQERATLTAFLAMDTSRQGHVAVITGEAGIGKTALVERFVADVSAAERILWGSCEALFTPRPLGPLYDIAQQAGFTLRSALNSEANRAMLFAAVLEDLRTTPTILVIEDIHWADEATLDLIKYLARRISQTTTLLLLTYREDELDRHHPLRLLLGDIPTREITRLCLSPLSEAAVAALAHNSVHPTKRLYATTGGNPFYVTEVLASDTARVPYSVSDAVLARVVRRSREAQRLLDVVSVAPGHIERWVVAALGVGDDAPLDECLAAGLLSLDGQMLAFRHELARQAVEAALPPARRQALNTQVLSALLESEIEPAALARLAHHATQAENAALVLRFTPDAAREAAARGARREAIAHYQTALRYADQTPPEQHAELLDGLSNELYLTGQMEQAISPCEAALALWRILDQPEKVGHDLRHLSALKGYLGKNVEAERLAAEAVELLETLPPGRELARAYSTMSGRRMLMSDPAQAVSWGERAMALAEKFGDFETVSAALSNMGSAEMCAGDPGGQVRLERSLAISLEHGYVSRVAIVYANLVELSVDQHAYAQAETYLRAGLAYCAEHDLDIVSQSLRGDWARMRLDQGDWVGADDYVTAILSLPDLAVASRITPLRILGLLRARRGAPSAEAPLDELRNLALDTNQMQCIAPMAAARAEWRWLQGDSIGCRAEAMVGLQLALEYDDPLSARDVSIWLWRGGDLRDVLSRTPAPHVSEIAGDWRAAATLWESLGCPYEQAMALLAGDEPARRTALAIFERLGAVPAAEIARQRLREAGVRGIPRGPRVATQANPHGLTPRQLEVLVLMAEGLHNGEIAARLSTTSKTVEHHVSAVLAKLNARSRSEAVSIAHTAGLIPHRALA
jgi:DNA-binding CsgD family transcriptional regulator/tetratricopeptide (TPR) repeat protein